MGREDEERREAVERTYRHYEIMGEEPPENGSEEWREMVGYYQEKVGRGE